MTAVPAPPSTFYVCPGERHAISRSVHWGRLAAFYEKCRNCAHSDDTGLLPVSVAKTRDTTQHSARQPLEFTVDGVRGRYLNDLDRSHAYAWAAALAAWLWDRRPLVGRMNDEAFAEQPRSDFTGPTVIVGYDERPSSPDVAVGVVTALRQMGCRVIDIGRATKPIWWFAARRTGANGGMFVTGAGCDAAWTGFDAVGASGMPVAPPSELAARVDSQPGRPTRTAGHVQTLAIMDEYVASLPSSFHALRPLRVMCATPLETLQFILPRLFQQLPCEFACLPWPRQRRSHSPGSDRFTAALREHSADVGILIDEDGQSCDVWNERGTYVLRDLWQPWLIEHMPLELDAAGRLWHHADDDRTCDGVVTFGAILQALSLSDAPLSQQMPA